MERIIVIYKILLKVVILPIFLLTSVNALSSEYSAFSDCGAECEKLYKQIKRFAINGSPHAQTMLAISYKNGEFKEKSSQQAWRWIKRARNQRFIPALYIISGWYRNGFHTEIDIDRADGYLKRAAEKNYPPAVLDQGKRHYENNEYEIAEKLINKAAKLGDINAKRLVMLMYTLPTTIAKEKNITSQKQDIKNEKDTGNVLTITASTLPPLQQLSFVLDKIKGMGVYNREGSVGSRVSDAKCGQIASNCRVMTSEHINLSGFNTTSGLLNGIHE